MTAEEYARIQSEISAAMGAYSLQFGKFFVNQALTATEWVALLKMLFNEVESRRYEAAGLARQFYDSQRWQYNPGVIRHDVFLEGYDFPRFVQAMEPIRKQMSAPLSPPQAVTMLSMQTMREVENAGRQQIIHAVEEDNVLPLKKKGFQATDVVRGWARVATGKETCAWCLMLISRGPVYLDSSTAGLDLPGWEAKRLIAAGEDVTEYMKEWHTGCDCKVVPVYDLKKWPGRDASIRARDLWDDAVVEAVSILENNPDKKSFVDGKWIPTTRNREAINTLRRRLERGDTSMTQFAIAA